MDEMLVIDIGGTKTNVSFVVADENEIKVISQEIFPTPLKPENAIKEIFSIYNLKTKKSNYLSLSLPGRWNKNGILKESFSLPNWIDYPFIENLSKELNIKNCIFETDVICGGLGEYHARACHGRSLLYINLGTGVGASLIKDGEPYKSDSKLTLRLQKLVFPFEDEIYSGVDLLSSKSLLKISNYNSIETLYQDFKLGKVNALDVIFKAQTQLAAWLINLFYLFAPDIIVLNGGLTYDFEVLAEGAIEIAGEELEDQVEIIQSKLKEQAPIHGAYLNAKQKLLLSTQESLS